MKESDQAWIYAMNGARHGPASAREVAALISSDRLPITALVWKPGMTDWVAASDVPEIASRCAPPLPASIIRTQPHVSAALGPRVTSPMTSEAPKALSDTGPTRSGASPLTDDVDDSDWYGLAKVLVKPQPDPVTAKSTVSAHYPDGSPVVPGVGGWLLLFCLGLVVLGPLATIGTLKQSYEALSPGFSRSQGVGAGALFWGLLLVCRTVFGFVAGVALLRASPRALRISKVYLASLVPSDFMMLLTPVAAEGLVKQLLGDLVYAAVWGMYLARSKRVRATYNVPEKLPLPR